MSKIILNHFKEYENVYTYNIKEGKFILLEDYKLTIYGVNGYKYFDDGDFEIFLYQNSKIEVDDFIDEAIISLPYKDNSSVWYIIIPLKEFETDLVVDFISDCDEIENDVVFITEDATEMHLLIEAHKDCENNYILRRRLDVKYPDLNKTQRFINDREIININAYIDELKINVDKFKKFKLGGK